MKNIGGFLGYLIGAVVIVPVLLVGVNYFFLRGNTDAKRYVDKYMRDSAIVTIVVPNYRPANVAPTSPDYMNYHLSEFKIFTTRLAAKNMGRDGSIRSTMDYRAVYDSSTRKYFQIIMFDGYTGFFSAINNRTVLAKVNKTDMNNPGYGTKEKPILVFSARGADRPLEDRAATDEKPEGFMMNMDTPVDQYRYNVFMYFTYIMPKKEFKERFEGKK